MAGEDDTKKKAKKPKDAAGGDWLKAEKDRVKAEKEAKEKDSKDGDKEKKKKKDKEKEKADDGAGSSSSSKKKEKDKEDKGDKGEKPKKESKDKDKDKEHADHHHKEKDNDKEKAAKKKEAEAKQASAAEARQIAAIIKSKKESAGDDYMKSFGLPSDDEEEDDYRRERAGPSTENGVVDEKKMAARSRTDDKDARKRAIREAEAIAKAEASRKEALKEDDSVYDVSFAADRTLVSSENTRDIKVSNLTIRVAGKVLLDHTDVTIAFGRRYALVGPNGHGKTTFMKMLGKRKIPVPENIDLLLVEQEMEASEQTALDAVIAADMELVRLRKLQEELENLSTNEDHTGELGDVYTKLKDLDSATAEPRAAKILAGLGFTPVMQQRATNQFSGGWRMRISLARALFIEPTLLLLDEPTNHLDLRAALWLEEYLKRWKKTLIVVSHDRDFLNSVVTDVIHVHDKKLDFYSGDFDQFYTMMEQRKAVANKAYEKYEKQIKASKGDKAAQEKALQKAALDAKKAGGKKSADGEVEIARPPTRWSDYTVQFEFPEPTELPPPLLQLIDVDFKYPGRDDFGMHNINLGVDMGTRVAIVGPNGAGKSTLLNLIAGDLKPTEGESRRSQKLRVGRYSQHFVDVLQMDMNPVQYLLNTYPQCGLNPEQMRAKLGKYGLPGVNHLQPICKLSGGQKARVVFASISLAQPHILLFDEPTNHLDLQSVDALAQALKEFTGGVVLISHDTRIISEVCEDETRSEVWVVEDGTVRKYNGTFEDYKDELIEEIIKEQDAD